MSSEIIFAGPNANLPQGQRRRVMNREAQRAFRARKEQRIKDLESELAELRMYHSDESERLQRENAELRSATKSMELELYMLRGALMAMDRLSTESQSGSGGSSSSGSVGSLHDGSVHSGDSVAAEEGRGGSSGAPHNDSSGGTVLDLSMRHEPEFAANASTPFVPRPTDTGDSDNPILDYTEAWEFMLERSFFEENDLQDICDAVKLRVEAGGIRRQHLVQIMREWEAKRRSAWR